ncbi:mycofactocin biosynthesis chaperone MftB [Georgenia sp. TF02-10]|uniref:mycofactocin biosynthesis chaperone MftB n=1 Tax=Georgenia sp. TF02-10 TaxID=2917725 RepID=UPI001FA6F8C8|nr:mycofactocin biosynthesis chaperone MftB [Georgenia sp. TF02-10]UNX54215.1 mycofactocin biosynthesis chaperone MftB [Georgenia sp. TF02-10]
MSTDTSATPAAGPGLRFDPAARWRVHPAVAVRPEPFGALLYHFDTRRLTFLKDRRLLEVVTTLASHATAREACTAAGVGPAEQAGFDAALQRLVDIHMLAPAEPVSSAEPEVLPR